MRGQKYLLQVAPEDCTGCNLCVEVCSAKDRQNPEIKAINMAARLDNLDVEKQHYDFFLQLPEIDPAQMERIESPAPRRQQIAELRRLLAQE